MKIFMEKTITKSIQMTMWILFNFQSVYHVIDISNTDFSLTKYSSLIFAISNDINDFQYKLIENPVHTYIDLLCFV